MSDFRQIRDNIGDHVINSVYLTLYGIVKYLPVPIGFPFRYLVTKPFIRRMGRTWIFEGVSIWFPHRLSIGNRVTLNESVFITAFAGVEIHDNVAIGHRSSIVTSDHVFADRSISFRSQGLAGAPVVIENDVYIGCNVTILKGVRIGTGAVVAAGSVVTKDVAPHMVVAGVPAEPRASRGNADQQNLTAVNGKQA